MLLPVSGRWELFLQTKLGGRVLTVPYTLEVAIKHDWAPDGATPLSIALSRGHSEIAAFLSGAGAKGDLPGNLSR